MTKIRPGESVKVHGRVVKSHLANFVMGEELARLQALEKQQGLPVHARPYAFLTISQAFVLAKGEEQTAGEAAVRALFRPDPQDLQAGNFFTGEANAGILPWVAKNEGGRLKQLFGQGEIKAGSEVTLNLTTTEKGFNLTGAVLEQADQPAQAAFQPKPVDVKMLVNDTEIPLHDYQVYAMNFIIEHPYCGIFLDIGLGKTLTTLAALQELRQKGMSGHILVIAPKAIARSTWQDELAKWQLPFKTQSFVVDEQGRNLTPKKRGELYQDAVKKAMKKDWRMYFINREMVVNLVENCPWVFKTVVIDESQSFKSPTAKRFKALRRVRPKIDRIIELTGTPAPNSLEDLWSQIYLLDQGQRLEKSITAYREKYFKPGMIVNNHPVQWKIIPGSEQEIYRKIDDIVISMKNSTIKLPPLTQVEDTVEMPPRARKVYQELKEDQLVQLTGGQEITAENAAVLAGRLLQLATGAIYEEDGVNYDTIFDEKLARCFYITSNTPSPCLVAYHFKSDAKRLLAYYAKNDQEAVVFDGSPAMVRKWNAGKLPVMLVQPASAGAGLNLQEGGHTLVWFTLPWSLEQYQQMNGRLYRQGQKKPVIIHHLLTKGTIDRHVLDSLRHKDMSQKALLAAVKRTI
ncbi:MAG: DEAD/DEAH box helicase [Lactobacillus sp.]|jgi:SNF2 family DNA or RNA helicase